MDSGFSTAGEQAPDEHAYAGEMRSPYVPVPEEAEAAAPSSKRWLLPAAAVALAFAWLVLMVWMAGPWLGNGPFAPQVATFVAALCVPPTLLAVLWLVFQRSSSAEARRFGDVSNGLRAEAESLERSVAALTERLVANRAELAEQANTLLAMAGTATERLAVVRSGMAQESEALKRNTELLGGTAREAEQRLQRLVQVLPDARAEISDIGRALDSAGTAAGRSATELDAQLTRLADHGREADAAAGAASERLAQHLARIEASSDFAGARLETVAGSMVDMIEAVLERTGSAIETARSQLAAEGDAAIERLHREHQAIERTTHEGGEAMDARIVRIEDGLARVGATLTERRRESDGLIRTLAEGIDAVDTRFAALHTTGTERAQSLFAAIDALRVAVDATTTAMRNGDATAHEVITTAERLLTALDASARELDETLPAALERLDGRLANTRGGIAETTPEVQALVADAEATHAAVEKVGALIEGQRAALTDAARTMAETLETGRERIDGVHVIVDATVATTRRFAEEAAPQLIEALEQIRNSATATAEDTQNALDRIVPTAAKRLQTESAAALSRAIDRAVVQQVASLGQAAAQAVEAAHRASDRLAQQLAQLSETSAAMETRMAEHEADREASDTDTLARRVSLLIEAMHSASIDITRAFSQEVTDGAWAAYLKGDRGVFTRRAVKLIDSADAREIAQFYDEDAGFREQVNRYIHDFEAMLRQILTLRDGSPLGVTLLSSDMGKLYVALAQAIERLRG
jgi:DNA repair exonuclease SbcCD ATPase subunit